MQDKSIQKELTRNQKTRLKLVLENEGIRQVELSRDSGIRHETISRVLNGRQEISPVTKSKLLKSLIRLTGNSNYTLEGLFLKIKKRQSQNDYLFLAKLWL